MGGEPLVFLQGTGYLIPGLDNELLGKSTGESFNAQIAAKDAYGERIEELVQAVPKSMFEGMDVQVGLQFRATTDDGEQSVIVIDVSDDHVVVDGNHPLSGHDLHFDVEVLSVRAATDDEVAHGHAHGPGGCGHNH